MPFEVHTFMQNTFYVNPNIDKAKEYDMRAGRIFVIARTNFFTGRAPFWIGGNSFDSCFEITYIDFSLIYIPVFCRIIPYLIDIILRQWRKNVTWHYMFVSCRLRAMKASKSKGVDGPLFSPSIRAL